MHIGYQKGTVGYNSSTGYVVKDGIVVNESTPYGKENNKTYVVGCGFNRYTNEAFFTLNGTKLSTVYVKFTRLTAAVSFANFKTMKINYGNEYPFVFDLKHEIENYGITDKFKESCTIA